MKITNLKTDELFADHRFNCRGRVSEIDILELAQDIKANGLHTPITVRELKSDESAPVGKKYKVIMGHRRHAAILFLKMPTIHCIIRNDLSDEQAFVFNLSENVQRKNLNILQEAKAIQHMVNLDMSRDKIAKTIGMSPTWVQVREMLLQLPSDVQQAAADNMINQTNIRELYAMRKHEEKMYSAVRKILEAKKAGKIVSVRAPNSNINAKRARKRVELFKMMHHIREQVGNNIGTRCLAWAAGEISDLELYGDIHDIDPSYVIPDKSLEFLE